ncbi:DUF4252 domain-containing protein [Chitinophaga qingshengii]|uniref:DUF4252 domain-containing protein n=1 Tax=Chitinophaga qingshengii TaxID=1569794 RepID=A0ABR7TSD4_9BACT|nr:DUF4252 domain-containing protein [Chitinophaga qingshengii]MBC9933383.1 DUF4252 domain-containing protein [Chitinophaga qingshengii]
MKKLLLGGCLLLAGVSTVMAQDKALREFRNKYRGKAEVVSVRLGSFPLRIAGFVMSFSNDKDVKTLRPILKDVRKIKVHTIENWRERNVSSEDVATLMHKLQDRDHFETLMEVRDKGTLVHILNKGKDDELGNVVMLIQEEGEFVMVNLRTSLKIADVNRLINQFASN